jgi:hypothetical protein
MNPYNRYNDNADGTNEAVLKTLYDSHCLDHVDKELYYLLRAFGATPFCGSGHPAPCNSWRTERIQHPTDQESDPRFTNRVHLFEAPRTGEHRVARGQMGPGQRCLGYVNLRPVDQTEPDSEYGRQVGLVNEKGKPERFYLRFAATATLAPPGFMLRPRYHVITCVAGPSEGVMPFRAVPYSHPEQFGLTRARCMHVALHCALMLKANVYHAVPLNSQDMVTVLWKLKNAQRKPGARAIPMSRLQKTGLSMVDARDLLQSPEVRASGVLEWVSQSTAPPATEERAQGEEYLFRAALRAITDYIANGVPVILDIGPERPHDRESSQNKSEWDKYRRSLTKWKGKGHAWLVIGFRMMYDPDEDRWPLPSNADEELQRIDVRELPSRFVVHDQFEGPYYRVYASKLLRRAWIPEEVQPNGERLGPGIRFLAVLPQHTRIGVQDVRRHAHIAARAFGHLGWQRYVTEELRYEAPSSENKLPWHREAQYVVHLLRSREIEQRYLGGPTRKNPSLQDHPTLHEAREALREVMDTYTVPTLTRSPGEEAEESGSIKTVDAPVSWWWAVEVRHPKGEADAPRRHRRAAPALVFLWPICADPNGSMEPAATIQYKATVGKKVKMQFFLGERKYTYDWFPDDADGGSGKAR